MVRVLRSWSVQRPLADTTACTLPLTTGRSLLKFSRSLLSACTLIVEIGLFHWARRSTVCRVRSFIERLECTCATPGTSGVHRELNSCVELCRYETDPCVSFNIFLRFVCTCSSCPAGNASTNLEIESEGTDGAVQRDTLQNRLLDSHSFLLKVTSASA